MDSRIFSKIKKGNIIPSFSLPDISGAVVSLDRFLRKKNLVIFFFNKLEDNCCKEFIKMLNGIYGQLKNQEAEVLAISQESLKPLREFAKLEDIKIILLLDKNGKVMDKFTYRDKNDNNICALFIVDKFGSLYKPYFHEPFSNLPDTNEIISSLEFLNKQCPECGVSTWGEES